MVKFEVGNTYEGDWANTYNSGVLGNKNIGNDFIKILKRTKKTITFKWFIDDRKVFTRKIRHDRKGNEYLRIGSYHDCEHYQAVNVYQREDV